MKHSIIGSIATVAVLTAACATETTESETVIPEGEIGSTAQELVKRKIPRVVARSASGTTASITLDRPLDPDEIRPESVKFLVVRASGAGFKTHDIAKSASLSSDRKTLNIALREPVKAGEIYHPRADWVPCRGVAMFGCKSRPARFGEIAVRSNRTSPFDLRNAGVLTADPKVFALARAERMAPPRTAVVLAEATPAAQGSFRVQTATPADLSVDVDRKIGKIVVSFAGGTVDCARTGRGKSAFHLHSVSPDITAQQSMYEDPAAATPGSAGYRGHIRCEEAENRIIFTPPGALLGDTQFQIDLNVFSKEGHAMTDKVIDFTTQRPGLQVLATAVENHYGGDNTCDDDVFGKNHCDVYVTTALATASAAKSTRIPENGDFSGMADFRVDPKGGRRVLSPPRLLYANASPVDQLVDIQMWAHDADDDSSWKKVLEVAGKIAGAASAALTPFAPEYGAIAAGASAGFAGLAEVIPSNEDDLLGSGHFILTSHEQRWGTQAPSSIVLDLAKGASNRGPVRVFLRTEELPPSWTPPPILQ